MPEPSPELRELLASIRYLHDRCGRPVEEHPHPHAPALGCPFPERPPVEFRQAPRPDPAVPVVTVCGLPEQVPPELVRALAELGMAAARAFDVPFVVVESDREEGG
jgi:hypothetical protein